MIDPSLRGFRRRVLLAAGIVTAIVIALLLLWFLAEVWLLLFGGLVFAILLRAITRPLARHLHLPEPFAFSLVVFLVVVLLVASLVLFLPIFIRGLADLVHALPGTLQRIADHLSDYPWGRNLLEQIPALDWNALTRDTFSHLRGFLTTTVGILSAVVVVFITGLFLAAEPAHYVGGALALFPPAARTRTAHVLREIRGAIEWWLLGRVIAMTLLGLFTWLALRWLDVPLAATLALLAAMLSFIPNIGALLSALPAFVVAAGVSPVTGGYVLLLYLVIHLIEAYLIGPIITRHTITLPPATVLIMQIAFTVLYGFLGLLLAGPLTVLLMVLVRTIYLPRIAADEESAR